MKYFILILILLALGLIGYNITLIDFSTPFDGDSIVALIGVFSALCAILLLVIFMLSKKIQDRIKNSK
ncbi:hypothetical protein [Sinomicrobium weinanense]|uniref:Uncharacterized protein n=1 Tax=Sinomicrobium weinanense TaxID=2842200 RepID=A0A926JP16_9FLAO|nr:hypothetical protein [Sinomicrobium weinanense]MBC9794852.1 hypothetical protein [Sinomicrobium weinanense]MBU3125623.1 hypothetical protein [Sinomicrobium weinanense]